jgi:hypothetical protein
MNANPMSRFRTCRPATRPRGRWLGGLACLLLVFCQTRVGNSQTANSPTAVEVSQALVIRNTGSVRVVGKDGVARSAYAGAVDASKPASGSAQPAPNAADPAPGGALVPVAAHLFAGETVTVGKDGYADLALAGVGVIRMQPESGIKLLEKTDKSPAAASFELLQGRLFISIDASMIKKQGNKVFILKTPAAILGVKGTRFFVAATGDGDVIGVHQGEVSVRELVSKQNQVLGAGRAIKASRGRLSPVRRLSAEELAEDGVYSEFDLERFANLRTDMNYSNLDRKFKTAGPAEVYWRCVAKGDRGGRDTIGMETLLSSIDLDFDGRKCWIRPLAKGERGVAVAGLEITLFVKREEGLIPVAVEFALAASQLKAFKIFGVTEAMKKMAMKRDEKARIQVGREKIVKVGEQPFWKFAGNDPLQLLPADQGLLVAAAGGGGWTRVQLAWSEIDPGGEGHPGFYFVTYPGHPDYAQDAPQQGATGKPKPGAQNAKPPGFSICDIEVLYRREQPATPSSSPKHR